MSSYRHPKAYANVSVWCIYARQRRCICSTCGRRKGATVNMLGVTFKENCSDVRNSKVIDIVQELASYGVTVHIHDPVADPNKVQREYGLSLTCWEQLPQADALVIAVPHEAFKTQCLEKMSLKLLPRGCVVDVKSVLDRQQFVDSGYSFWRL